MNEGVVCSRCMCPGYLPNGQVVTTNRPMELIGQFEVRGIPTFAFHCLGCNGKAHVQQVQDQQGSVAYRQVQLTGSDREYMPHSIKPTEQVQIPVAYTIGDGGQTARHFQTQPIAPPPAAFSLDPRQDPRDMLNPNDHMHPENLRRRLQPIRPGEFFGQ